MKDRVINVLFSLDCFLFSIVTFGGSYPFESFSSAAYRAEKLGKFYGKARPLIDLLFWFQPDHCKQAYERAYLNLPPDQHAYSKD